MDTDVMGEKPIKRNVVMVVLLLANSYMLYTALDRAVLSLLDAKISVSYYTFALSIAQLITSVVYSHDSTKALEYLLLL